MLILILFTFQCSCQEHTANVNEVKPPSHELWTALLKKYVSATGQVNYKAIKQNKAELETYLSVLRTSPPNDKWTVNEQKTFWINAYNGFTIELVVNHYPVKSIKDIGGILKYPWKKEFIQIADKTYSLDYIEHKILRKKFYDPRIHFAINCASKSCPQLLNEAYQPSKLDDQLNQAAIRFVNDSFRNNISANSVAISAIFKWFSNDFTKSENIISFLNQYAKTKINPNPKISYLDYNWSLNE